MPDDPRPERLDESGARTDDSLTTDDGAPTDDGAQSDDGTQAAPASEDERTTEGPNMSAAEMSPAAAPAIPRRSFIAGGIGIATLLTLGGVSKAFATGTVLMRPPGAQDEARLSGSCIRCDRCRSACHTDVIAVGSLDDGVMEARTPKMDFHLGFCDFCEGEFRCEKSCPTGAIGTFDPASDKIGVAVIDSDECLLFKVSATCSRKCVDACEYDALSLDDVGRIVVDEDACNGCGACEFVCPSASYRTYNGSKKRGINVEAWEGERR